jgi:hypothetical protein
MADHNELKHLLCRKEATEQSIKALKDQQQDIVRRLQQEKDTLVRINQGIDRIKRESDKLVVSEHAILRYFEKVLKFDIEEIKKKILPAKQGEQVKVLGSGTFTADTHRLRVKNGVVVTILTDDE